MDFRISDILNVSQATSNPSISLPNSKHESESWYPNQPADLVHILTY
jgi:hypothetical protein